MNRKEILFQICFHFKGIPITDLTKLEYNIYELLYRKGYLRPEKDQDDHFLVDYGPGINEIKSLT